MPALDLKSKQASELNACWNSVFRKIFGFNKWESVRLFIHGLGRLDFIHILLLRRHKFYRHLCSRDTNVFLKDVFWLYWSRNYDVDTCCRYVCMDFNSAYDAILNSFSSTLNWDC